MTIIRRRIRSLSWLALFTFLWGVALRAIETHDVADPETAGIGSFARSGGSLRIEQASGASSGPEHCVVCHWQRAVSGALVSGTTAIASPCLASVRGGVEARRLTASEFSFHASRAPPIHS